MKWILLIVVYGMKLRAGITVDAKRLTEQRHGQRQKEDSSHSSQTGYNKDYIRNQPRISTCELIQMRVNLLRHIHNLNIDTTDEEIIVSRELDIEVSIVDYYQGMKVDLLKPNEIDFLKNGVKEYFSVQRQISHLQTSFIQQWSDKSQQHQIDQIILHIMQNLLTRLPVELAKEYVKLYFQFISRNQLRTINRLIDNAARSSGCNPSEPGYDEWEWEELVSMANQ